MKDVYLKINGYVFCEPMTSITDFLICIFSIFFYITICTYHNKESFEKKWSYFYLWMFISTLIGTFAHGARYYLSDKLFSILWMAMNIAGIISTYFSIYATISYSNYKDKVYMKTINFLTSALFMFVLLTVVFNNFVFVKIFAAIGLLYIFFTHFKYYRKGILGNGKIAFGIGVSFVTVFIHSTKLSFHKHFNYKDISHVIMIISLYLIFTGIKFINKERYNKVLSI